MTEERGSGEENTSVAGQRLSKERKILEAWEEDRRDPILIPLKALIPAIPREDGELQELAGDLRVMGCEDLLAKPWNL